MEDGQGNIWFSTSSSGVSKYNPNGFSHYMTRQGLVHNIVRTFSLDKKGRYWFGMTRGGINRYDPPIEGLNGRLVYFNFEESGECRRLKASFKRLSDF